MKRKVEIEKVVSFGCRFDQYDPRDFRYTALPVALPTYVDNRAQVARIMNQNPEGSCTGHAVCGAAEFHYWRKTGKKVDLSQRWAYRKARENDPWPGENYHGSTTRAAVKAWANFGICEEEFWPYDAYQVSDDSPDFNLVEWEGTPKEGAIENALKYPMLSYSRCYGSFEIKHAIHEHGVVIVGAVVHSGWNIWGADTIKYDQSISEWGGHAFILVGYHEIEKVYYVANSWGTDWGDAGFAKYPYSDAKENIRDAWAVTVPT
ncbi:MAG: C1 family peptidase [Anaerolineales bacterium]|nr:C1 family peptidase [Anaerolineales bacterium]